MGDEIKFIDTTIRDGSQSLWALNMKTGMMLSALPHLDAAGFDAIEFYAPSGQIKKMAHHLGEDSFEWLKLGMKLNPKTELRVHGGIRGALGKVPFSAGKLLMDMCVAYGLTVTRTSDPWNDFPSFATEHNDINKCGVKVVMNVIYSESAKHTNDYYRERVKQAADLRPYRICFKDVGGLLTPERTRELLPIFQESAGDVEIEFHAHCNNGLAPLNVLEVAKGGVRYIHTSLPPLANGTGQPSVFNVAQNLRALGFDAAIDEEPLGPAMENLTSIAHDHDMPIGAPRLFDQSIYHHQVPGGMISNLAYQLRLVGMEDRLQETLEEAVRVRAEFGFPIMVTPLSQFVGSQAAINVIVGERYKQVSDEVIQYAIGLWGREPVTDMDQQVRAKILDRGRAREWARWEQPEPSLKELRHKYGDNISDEELLMRVYAGDDYVDLVGMASRPEDFLSARQPLVMLLDELVKKRGFTHVVVQKGDLSLTLGGGSGSGS